jgi:hypothetical protein
MDLEAHLKDDGIFEELMIKYPELYSDMVLIRQNSPMKGDCVKRITSKLSTDPKFCELVIKPTSQRIDMRGLVLSIDKTDSAYQEIIRRAIIENWMYTGISVVDAFDKMKLYFY